jgi:hypothetical protein
LTRFYAGGRLGLLLELHDAFDQWRSPFFGRSGVQCWWGGFDLTATLFTGRRSPLPAKPNYIQRYDLDAEHLTVGFWPGDDTQPARFFGYVVPEPPGCPVYRLGVPQAAWAATMGEWVLPYEAVRDRPDRIALVRAFADTIKAAARDLGGWPMDEFTYRTPPRPSLDRL